MKVIIPMSGVGKRFAEVGYTSPKPLIKICGKPIIEYVVDMFPGDHDFIFICNKSHLESTPMRSVLTTLKPKGKIITIDPHSKGPVFAVSHVFDEVNDDDEVMISYCDYSMDWDFDNFQKQVHSKKYDAAVPCYIGFHPHLIHNYLYAGVLTDGNGTMTNIKEKHCFTEKSTDCHQSAGAYYFRRGSDMKSYLKKLIDEDMNLKGEYYVSSVYELLLRDKLKSYIPEADRFYQFGTPEDLEDFEAWAEHFAELWQKEKPASDIPPERKRFVKIPVKDGSEEFNKSKKYWEPVFKRLFHIQ